MGTRHTSALHQDSAKSAAIRKTIIHIIASEPKPATAISRLTRTIPDETKQILDRVASLDTNKYKLIDRAYKELDLWSFPYKSEDERQSAVENAIKAYDRMRMSKDDPLWQKLLPKEERGKGKCLSRLKINAPAQAPAPAPLNLKKEKKDGTAKKAEAKKAAAAEEGEKKNKEKDPIIRKVTKKIDSVMSSIERTKKEPKRPAKKNPPASEPAKASVQKQKKEAAKPPTSGLAKSPSKPVTNKPKTPSPLSASPPVNASDFEEDHPVHKALSAAASPTKASTSSSDRPLKYRLERSEKQTAPAKQRKSEQERTPVNGFRPGTSSASSSAEKKRKIADVDHSDRGSTPQKKRHLDLINTTAASSHVTHSHSHSHSHSQKIDTSTSPSSSSPTSPLLPLTYQQTIALSQKFHIYYEKYYKLHTALNQSNKPPTKQQRDDLWKMHEMLAKMKEEIRVGAQRQH
jgi:RNA polymerase II elongation factor ELL